MNEESTPWSLLRDALDELRSASHAHNAYVLDETGRLWCSAIAFGSMDPTTVVDMIRDATSRIAKPLRRGGRLDGTIPKRSGYAYVKSFANVYVVMVRFSAPFDVPPVRAAVAAALEKIEALTLALPPPDGPGDAGAEGALRA